MPELPEVETIRRGLDSRILQRKIAKIDVLNEKSFRASAADIKNFAKNADVTSIGRRGKMLIIGLSSDYSLLIHLRMTGQLIFRSAETEEKFAKKPGVLTFAGISENENNFGGGHPTDSMIADLPDRSTRIIFTFSDGAKLFFNDQRKFGFAKLTATNLIEEEDFLKKLGPEIIDFTAEKLAKNPSEETFAKFIENARHHQNSPVKSVILDQHVVAGIGNIYADEALWGAKIHPATRVKALSDQELREILVEAKVAMEKSLAAGGSTMKNYVRADGTKGNYLDKFANVFRRVGKPCPRCGTEVIKLKVAGRGTHICAKCQKLKGAK
jgi:formamidopyrimidine-DNA glycosylase